ncbi:unnamed protein product [Gongylonema pulchrum]|uniref:7TM_GPCR_Srx domain-containing protein n=1 Tax=Gongylonema pulchrum TaxID=637853 RepID=A0A183E6D5_9BILA|nr:unnamed protein product [Gongylonema pulchrum]
MQFFISSEARISMSQGLCYGLAYRTSSHQESCNDFLRPFHTSLATKLGLTSHTNSIRFVISFSMSGLAIAHTVTSAALAYYNASENSYLIRSYHGQLVISIIMFPAALLHRFYCCTYFYLWPAVLVAFYGAFQSAITWKYQCRGKFVRLANVFGSAAAMALVAAASFGLFCTFVRVIDFRSPYSDWLREYVTAETSAIQIFTNLWICFCAFALFFFSLKSAFTTEIMPSLLSPE